ncbi:MAG: response regulator [Candidatus Gastranaerophilales bacterium]|nr:response regulator [Candidatus Gastranaerophilales bacterium]
MARVMIVDNVAFERISMKDIISKAGHEIVAEALTGSEAIKMYPVCQPDYVIMDIAMPDDDGVAILKEMLQKYPEAKICICTALAQQAIVIEVIQAGAVDFIVKPYRAERVKQSIRRALEQ